MTNEEMARFFNNVRPFIQGNPNLRDPPKADPPRKAGRIDQHRKKVHGRGAGMSSSLLTSQIGQRISLPGHFDAPVIREDVRPLGSDDSAGYECRVRLPDGSLEEAVISAEEVVAVLGKGPYEAKAETLAAEVFVKRVDVKGRLRGQPVRYTTNEWYKAQQLAETCRLYVVWGPLVGDSPEIVHIHNPAAKLDRAKREIAAARLYEIPADAIVSAVESGR